MAIFQLFDGGTTIVNIEPEYDFKDGGRKIENVHRTRSGAEFRYLWGDYEEVSFSLQYVNSSDACVINSWWGGNEDLIFAEVDPGGGFVTPTIKYVHITNKDKPITENIKPYREYFKGKIVLGTYL